MKFERSNVFCLLSEMAALLTKHGLPPQPPYHIINCSTPIDVAATIAEMLWVNATRTSKNRVISQAIVCATHDEVTQCDRIDEGLINGRELYEMKEQEQEHDRGFTPYDLKDMKRIGKTARVAQKLPWPINNSIHGHRRSY